MGVRGGARHTQITAMPQDMEQEYTAVSVLHGLTPELGYRHQDWQWDEHRSRESWHYSSALGNLQEGWRNKASLWKKEHSIEIFLSRHTARQAIKWWEVPLNCLYQLGQGLSANFLREEGRELLQGFLPTLPRTPSGCHSHNEERGGSGLVVSPVQPCIIPGFLSHRKWNHSCVGATEVSILFRRVPIPSDMPPTSRPYPHSIHTSIWEALGYAEAYPGRGQGKNEGVRTQVHQNLSDMELKLSI